MTIVVRLDHHTIITEVDLPNVIIHKDDVGTSAEFHSHLPAGVPTVTVLLMMDRKEALSLITKLTR